MNNENKKGDLIQEPVKQGEIVRDVEKKDVTIKISEPDFAQMVVDLLGKKQTLEKEINEAFLLKNIGDIAQFHYLLTEKIEKEQHTTLNLFSVTILYNDNSKRTVNDVKNIESFLETRNVIAQSVFLAWEIVLKYPNKDSIEKQKLEVSFSVKNEPPFGNIKINIEHTSQVWANEVLMLFQSHINKLILPQKRIAKILREITSSSTSTKDEAVTDEMRIFAMYSILLLILLIFMVLIIMIQFQGNHYSMQQLAIKQETSDKLMNILNNQTKTTNSKSFQTYLAINLVLEYQNSPAPLMKSFIKTNSIDQDIQNILNEFMEKYVVTESRFDGALKKLPIPLILFLGIFIAISYYLDELAKLHEEKSFILITTEAEKQYTEYMKSKTGTQFISFNAIMIAIICSLIGGLILEVLKIFAQ